MAEVQRLEAVVRALRDRAARHAERASVVVGYTAAYALFVHENMEMKLEGQPRPSGLGVYWGPEGAGPKFLEGPARENRDVLAEIVKTAIRQGKTEAQALLLAGLRLQRESQLRVPVEFGNLKNSAFTRLEPA